MFANIIVSTNELRDDVNTRLQKWQDILESKSFKISVIIIKYMNCNFNGDVQKDETSMRIETH